MLDMPVEHRAMHACEKSSSMKLLHTVHSHMQHKNGDSLFSTANTVRPAYSFTTELGAYGLSRLGGSSISSSMAFLTASVELFCMMKLWCHPSPSSIHSFAPVVAFTWLCPDECKL